MNATDIKTKEKLPESVPTDTKLDIKEAEVKGDGEVQPASWTGGVFAGSHRLSTPGNVGSTFRIFEGSAEPQNKAEEPEELEEQSLRGT